VSRMVLTACQAVEKGPHASLTSSGVLTILTL
jgi:hypothetical protein